jgi:hypothetical protein
MAEEAYN